jgi:hypothetical protein
MLVKLASHGTPSDSIEIRLSVTKPVTKLGFGGSKFGYLLFVTDKMLVINRGRI